LSHIVVRLVYAIKSIYGRFYYGRFIMGDVYYGEFLLWENVYYGKHAIHIFMAPWGARGDPEGVTH
jgi:hypothetical protein